MSQSPNVLAQGMEVIGSIKFSNEMIIDGKVEGEVVSDSGKLTVGQNAKIKGDIKSGEVKLYGEVEGTIKANRGELKKDSQLKGDIAVNSLNMEEGAKLSGSTSIGGGK